MAYKLAIFDFDGTLADSGAWMFKALNEMAEQYGIRRVDAEEAAMLRGLDNRAIIRHLGVPAWKLPFLVKRVRERVTQEAPAIPLFEGTPRMLRTLTERGMALAVVSSNSEDNVRRIFGPDCAGLIGCYECGASIFGKAPKFRRVLERTGMAPGEAICIGDEARDIEAAAEAGLASGAVTWGYATAELLERMGPTMLFGSMGEILDRLAA